MRPPSTVSMIQPSEVKAFFTAGPRTPTPFAECLPRPVMILTTLSTQKRLKVKL